MLVATHVFLDEYLEAGLINVLDIVVLLQEERKRGEDDLEVPVATAQVYFHELNVFAIFMIFLCTGVQVYFYDILVCFGSRFDQLCHCCLLQEETEGREDHLGDPVATVQVFK